MSPKQVNPSAGEDWGKVQYNSDPKIRDASPGQFYWSNRYLYHFGIMEIKKQTDLLRRYLPNVELQSRCQIVRTLHDLASHGNAAGSDRPKANSVEDQRFPGDGGCGGKPGNIAVRDIEAGAGVDRGYVLLASHVEGGRS